MSEESDVLADILLQAGLLSESQLELALADHDVSGIPLEEVIFMRGWCSADVLYNLAPWLKPGSQAKTPWEQEEAPKKYQRRTGENVKPQEVKAEAAKQKEEVKAKEAPRATSSVGSSASFSSKTSSSDSGGGAKTGTAPQTDYKENLQRYNDVVRSILGKEID